MNLSKKIFIFIILLLFFINLIRNEKNKIIEIYGRLEIFEADSFHSNIYI